MSKIHRLIPVMALTALLALVIVPTANAAVTIECVGFATPAADCTNSYNDTQLQTALNAVSSDGEVDTVRLAAGTYLGFHTITSPNSDKIVGAGQGLTILRNTTADSNTTLALNGTGGSIVVNDMTIERQTGTSGASALIGQHVFADHVTVKATSANGTNGKAALVANTVIQRSIIEVSGDFAWGVYSNGGDVVVEDSVIRPTSANTYSAFFTGNGLGTLRRSRVGDPGGIGTFQLGMDTDSGTMLAVDSLIDLGGQNGAAAIHLANNNAGVVDLGLIARRVTIVGSGSSQTGIYVQSALATGSLDATIDASVLSLSGPTPNDITCNRGAASNITGFAVTYTAWDLNTGNPGFACVPSINTNNIDTDSTTPAAMFRDPATRDWRPKFGGPLVDAGDPAAVLGLDTDAFGAPRLVDGAAPVGIVHDIGAIEYQHKAPVATASALPTSALTGVAIAFSGTAVDTADGETATITGWSFGDGSTSTLAAPTHAYAAAGTYVATATATDVSGLTGTATVSVKIAAPAAPADTTKPVLTALGPLKAIPFLRSGKVFSTTTLKNARALRLTLSEPATVKLMLARKVGKKFVAYKGNQSFSLKKGAARLTWTGKWQKTLLPVGTYRVTLVATDKAGNKSIPKLVNAQLVKPPKLH